LLARISFGIEYRYGTAFTILHAKILIKCAINELKYLLRDH